MPSAIKRRAADSNLNRCRSKLWKHRAVWNWIKRQLCALNLTLHRVFFVIQRVTFESSFLPIGKLSRKISPVDCIITWENYFFAPKTQFTQTVTWHGIRVKAEINKFYLENNPIEQCGASASEDCKLRRRGKSFTDDSLMCGEEAALSLRRLSGENLLFYTL